MQRSLNLFVITAMLAIAWQRPVRSEYYSSIIGLEHLLQVENVILNELKESIETSNDDGFISFLKFIETEHTVAEEDTDKYLSNPINAFRLIKRLSQDLGNRVVSVQNVDNGYEYSEKVHTTFEYLELPSLEDLVGSTDGLLRLQSVYKLNISDLVEGIVYGNKYGSGMSPSDCLHLGKHLLETEQYDSAVSWFNSALSRLYDPTSINIPYVEEDAILEYLRLAKEDLALKPTPTPENATLTSQELYVQTCRGELTQTAREKRDLRCRYVTNNVPFLKLAPLRVEEYNLDPYVVVFHNVVSDTEIARIRQTSDPMMSRSKIGKRSHVNISERRISKSAWMFYQYHPFLKTIFNRLQDMTGLDMNFAEALQVANYGIGGHFLPHWDFVDHSVRIATVVFYASEVKHGGATAFPFLRIAVPPQKGSALMWFNRQKSLKRDWRVKHAGCPVLMGSKWILTEWISKIGQEFHRPCGLAMEKDTEKYRLWE